MASWRALGLILEAPGSILEVPGLHFGWFGGDLFKHFRIYGIVLWTNPSKNPSSKQQWQKLQEIKENDKNAKNAENACHAWNADKWVASPKAYCITMAQAQKGGAAVVPPGGLQLN